MGTVKRCKRDGCYEPAVDHTVKTEGFKRKQYCAAHYEQYKAKQRSYLRMRAKLPDCINGCGAKVSLTRLNYGHHDCAECAERDERRDALLAIQQAFEDADTVDALKDFLREHLLPDVLRREGE